MSAPTVRRPAWMVEYEVTDREGDTARLRLHGRLSGDTPSEHLKEALERHYVDDGVQAILTDLSGLDELSLEGAAVLLELWRESQERGKRFEVHNARGQVHEKLVVTGLLRLLDPEGPAPA